MAKTSNYTQYMRQYRLTIIRRKTNKTNLQIEGLRIVFHCEKSMNDTPNYSIIKVYNLRNSTIGTIRDGDTVVLEAGYENGNFGMIFTGQIVQPKVFVETPVDSGLMLIVQDGDKYLKNSFVSKTVSKHATKYDIVTMCIDGKDDVKVGVISPSLSDVKLPRGKVLFGSGCSYMRKAARKGKSTFYIEDGTINIVSAKSFASNRAVELNPSTGLIGRPEQTDDGVSGQCLINPSIRLNTKLHIDRNYVEGIQVEEGKTKYKTPSAKGVYKVTKLVYEGDSRGDDWYCSFEAVSISFEKAKKKKT